jgi:hypothetical protein
MLPELIKDATNALPEIYSVEELGDLVGQLTRREMIELSKIKKILIQQFQLVLNPGRLGFIKLSEIFEKKLNDKFILIKKQNTVFVKRRPLNSG